MDYLQRGRLIIIITDPSSYPSLFRKSGEIRKDDRWLPLLAALVFTPEGGVWGGPAWEKREAEKL